MKEKPLPFHPIIILPITPIGVGDETPPPAMQTS